MRHTLDSRAVLILLSALAIPPGLGAQSPATIPPAKAVLAGLSLGLDSAGVSRIRGRPDSIGPARFEAILDDSVRTWFYREILVTFYGARVQELECRTSACRTADGIRLGSAESRLIATYGQPYRSEHAPEHRAYPIRDQDCWLGFDIRHGRIVRIRVECDYS